VSACSWIAGNAHRDSLLSAAELGWLAALCDARVNANESNITIKEVE